MLPLLKAVPEYDKMKRYNELSQFNYMWGFSSRMRTPIYKAMEYHYAILSIDFFREKKSP